MNTFDFFKVLFFTNVTQTGINAPLVGGLFDQCNNTHLALTAADRCTSVPMLMVNNSGIFSSYYVPII